MIGIPSRRRLMGASLPAILLAALSLAACSVNPLASNPAKSRPLTAADILQSATSVLNLHATGATSGSSNATVKDLTFSMKFDVKMNMTSSPTGTGAGTGSDTSAQSLSDSISATGQQTLNPRRSKMDMTMSFLGQNLTLTSIVDYASSTGYIKMAGSSLLPGTASGKWYSMSFASIGGLGADTSMYMDYSKLKNAKLIGSEQINGVSVWHIRATQSLDQATSALPGGASGATAGGSVSVNATSDYYFRQDNYRPVKVVISGSDNLSALGTMTMDGEMDFTSFNTGISIALPAASDVQPMQALQ